MNLIKFKDELPTGLNPTQLDKYVTYFKGRYALFIRMRWAIPVDKISVTDYVGFERNGLDPGTGSYPDEIYSQPWIADLDGFELGFTGMIDEAETNAINDLSKYIYANSIVTDEELTIDQIKRFRTWLAESLLEIGAHPEESTEMLDYYAKGMYNAIVKSLGRISGGAQLIKTGVSGCGCGSGTNLSGLYNESLSVCDPLDMYRQHIYKEMVALFSTISFWQEQPVDFIKKFKQYIDNIIRLNLPLRRSAYAGVFADCTCVPKTGQEEAIQILIKLSVALSHIIDGSVAGNLNLISNAFNQWAAELYEMMEWS